MKPPRGPSHLEAPVRKDIRDFCKFIGAYCYSPVPIGYGVSTVDHLICWRGRFYAVEAKRPDTRPAPTKRQEDVLTEVAEAGGGICVAYDWSDVAKLLGVPMEVWARWLEWKDGKDAKTRVPKVRSRGKRNPDEPGG